MREELVQLQTWHKWPTLFVSLKQKTNIGKNAKAETESESD